MIRALCLNAPDGAGCSLTEEVLLPDDAVRARRLNAPDGAGCSLTPTARTARAPGTSRLNADGAGCSLTGAPKRRREGGWPRLNAPDGAGCSLTPSLGSAFVFTIRAVLMHLMVLGAP